MLISVWLDQNIRLSGGKCAYEIHARWSTEPVSPAISQSERFHHGIKYAVFAMHFGGMLVMSE